MTTTTARQILDEARVQDARFFDLHVPEGALLLTLNTTHRRLLLRYADAVQPFVDQSAQIAATVSGSLVGVDTNGNPYYITTPGTGWAVSNAGTVNNPIPYVDFSGTPVSLDPFGQNGGTPGFPLPSDLIKLIQVVGSFQDGTICDIDLINERNRAVTGTHNPTAFINGNRLVPVRDSGVISTNGWPDLWTSIANVTLTYLAVPTLTSLDDVLTIPTVLQWALVAAVAAHLARTCPECTGADRQAFQVSAAAVEEQLRLSGSDMLGELTQNSIIFHAS